MDAAWASTTKAGAANMHAATATDVAAAMMLGRCRTRRRGP
jgi:hypothetical protein